MIQRAAAAVLFAAIVVLCFEWGVMTLPFRDRHAMAQAFASRPDRGYPDYRLFLADVRERTQNGDSIAILVPLRQWEYGYSDAYYRASYALAGREVLPLVYPEHPHAADNLRAAKYVAAWRIRPPAGEIVMQSHGGVLVKRR